MKARAAVLTRPPKKTKARRPVSKPAGRRSAAFVWLFAIVVVLNLVGLLMILSASSVTSLEDYGSPWYQFLRQVVWYVPGIPVFLVALRLDYHRWQRFTQPLLLVALALLLAVLLPGIGKRVNGAKRWIGIGSIGIQPSEVAKLALVLWVADLLSRRAHRIEETRLSLRPVLVVFGVMAGLIMLEPNLGTTIIIFAIVFVMLFVAGTPGPYLVWLFGAALAAGTLAVASTPFRRARFLAFLDPMGDPLNTGYQNTQSNTALANGGLTGTGIGQGRSKYGFLPEAETDFIFSVLAEETGFIGAVLLLGVFLALCALGVRVAMRAPDRFGMLVAAGITAWFLFQAFVNIGAAVGVMPLTGVPLPFVSLGGSALVVNLFAAGVLLNIARHTS